MTKEKLNEVEKLLETESYILFLFEDEENTYIGKDVKDCDAVDAYKALRKIIGKEHGWTFRLRAMLP